MPPAQALTFWGGMLILVGLLLAVISNWFQTKVLGDAALGVGVWSPKKDSPAWREKVRLRRLADRLFWIGIALSAIGGALQTAGALWPTSL